MPCYYPLTQYRSKKNDGTYTFNTKHGYIHSGHNIKCGQCWGCQLDYAREWATRCMHHAQMHKYNQYVTLTLDDENLPSDNTLHKPHLTNFWKRLRKAGYKFSYYACGEYGDTTHRPHYHAIIFGLELHDKIYYRRNLNNNLYTSETLKRLWTHGNVIIGNVSFESCSYVARYINKKQGKKVGLYEYEIIDNETGEILDHLTPEFSTMSKGIGKSFYEKYHEDMFTGTDGTCVVRGDILTPTPKYYNNIHKKSHPKRMEEIQNNKRKEAIIAKPENTRARLMTREQIAIRVIQKKLVRPNN